MCKKIQTGWFLRLSDRRMPDGKKDYARDADGRRMVYTDDEARVEMRGIYIDDRWPYTQRLEPAYGPEPTSKLRAFAAKLMDDNQPGQIVAPLAADMTATLGPSRGVDPATIPVDPREVPDEMYDRFTPEQRRAWASNMGRRVEDRAAYPSPKGA